MNMICQKCGSPNITLQYDRELRRSVPRCLMCGTEYKPVSKSVQNIPQNIPEEKMNVLPQETILGIQKAIQEGTSVRKLMRKFNIAKETARKYMRNYYKDTGEERPENRGGSERKPENIDKPRPKCKVEGCDRWPVRDGLCTRHFKKEVDDMATEIKGSHKACKNHPDKYAVARELCAACIKKEKKAMAIREAQAMGLPLSDADKFIIGKKYGVSATTISNWLKEIKQAAPKVEMTEIRQEETSIVEQLRAVVVSYEEKIRALNTTIEILSGRAA